MAQTFRSLCPVDGAMLVLMSLLLKRNITFITYSEDCPIWHANNEVEQGITLVYCRESHFIEAEVGTYIFHILFYRS